VDTIDHRHVFATAIQPHLAEGFGLARSLAGNRADAQDVLQDAAIRALRAVGQIRGGSPRAWFMAIVRNTAYSFLVRRRRLELAPIDDDVLQVPATDTWVAPDAALIARVDGAALQAAIQALPESFRMVVILRDVQGFNYREIAEITGVPLGTVMSRLARARRRLLSQLRTVESVAPTGLESRTF
jgi:RNA polymerase sigma factor (sigma-70 family)